MTRADSASNDQARKQSQGALTLAALGVVYGDIGTSPLYTVKEIFAPHTGVALTPANLVGAVSVIFWALMLVVTLKYVTLILRADNHGEGGVLALTALAARAVGRRPRWRAALILLGTFAATLFYGDSVITPAISVLGAMEGLQIVAPALGAWALPAAVAILVALFLVQRFGTARVGGLFGPVIALWFGTLAVTGALHIAAEPAILAALNPLQAWRFLLERGPFLFLTVGAVVLAITGAEALYADMGHFGRKPIRLAWSAVVLPALTLNYLGQGALLIAVPGAIENPFFRLFPPALLLPALVLATLAAIIASQAVISGAYSMTKQAIQLGLLPRMPIRNTSEREAGQIYMPSVNWVLLAGVLAATVGFGSSSALAGAYGIAVTLTMLITTLLTWVVIRRAWQLPGPVALAATGFFVVLDLLLVAGCMVKLLDGGWFPLALAALLFVAMSTWWLGRIQLLRTLRSQGIDWASFLSGVEPGPARVPRYAVFPVADASTVPPALLHNLKHNGVLHARNVVLTVAFAERPWVPDAERVELHPMGAGFWRITLHFGFMDTPDVPRALGLAALQGLELPPAATSYFLSRETVVPARAGAKRWRARLFAAMSRNAGGVVEYFRLPDNAVVELGTRVQL